MSVTLSRPNSGWDLKVGEPRFLWDTLRSEAFLVMRHGRYPEVGGEKGLVDALRERHGKRKRVVVTAGAKQGLLASFWAVRELSRGNGPKYYFAHPSPRWPSFSTLAHLAGLQLVSEPGPGTLCCVSALNNPDGKLWSEQALRGTPIDVLDCAYAHPVYGYCGPLPEARCQVWSAGKLYGIPGARVGWVVTEDDELADKVAEYVEETTSGVPTESQEAAYDLVRAEMDGDLDEAYGEAQCALEANGKAFSETVGPFVDRCFGAPNGRGMFAWFHLAWPRSRWFAAQKGFEGDSVTVRNLDAVHLVPGEACGATEPGWWRASLGGLPEYTRGALSTLAERLAK